MSDNRIKILEATVEAMAESGLRGLRLEEVAARADVAVSLIFYHFGNRIDLLRATFQYVSERAPSTVMAGEGTSDGFHRIEAGMVKEFKRPRARMYSIAWSELSAYAVFEPSLRGEVDAVNRAWVANLEEVIRAGQADGSVQSNAIANDEAEILTALVDGLVFRWISRSISTERATELVRLVLRQHLKPAINGTSEARIRGAGVK